MGDCQIQREAVAFQRRRGAELGGVAYMFVRAGEKSESLEGNTGVFVADAAAISQESCRAAIKNALK